MKHHSARRPVFLDSTGRRRRTIRRTGAFLAVPTVGYLVLMASSLLGGPRMDTPLIPLPEAAEPKHKPTAPPAEIALETPRPTKTSVTPGDEPSTSPQSSTSAGPTSSPTIVPTGIPPVTPVPPPTVVPTTAPTTTTTTPPGRTNSPTITPTPTPTATTTTTHGNRPTTPPGKTKAPTAP